MTDEKLTEGERSYLVHMALVLENHHVPEAAKALRCLDAALARVAELRALADERGDSVTKLVDRVQYIAQERDRAVSDAAEARAEAAALRTEVERLRARVAELESIKPLLDAEQLSARLTEAERLYIENHHIPEVAKAIRCLDAALARVAELEALRAEKP